HQDCADLGDGVERLQLLMHVRRDVSDPVARLDTQPLQGRRPAVAAIEKLLVGESQVTLDDGVTPRIEPASSPHELKRREWRFHALPPAPLCPESNPV